MRINDANSPKDAQNSNGCMTLISVQVVLPIALPRAPIDTIC